MKKAIKISLCLAGVLFVLGLALHLVGEAMGGRRESQQYYQHYVDDMDEFLDSLDQDGVWGPINVSSDGVHVGGENGIHVSSDGIFIGGNYVGNYGEETEAKNTQLVDSWEPGQITSVEADLNCGDLQVREGDEFSLSLSWNIKNYYMAYHVENGVLKVEDEMWGKGHWEDNFQIECIMLLTVPEGTSLDTLDLSTDFGDIEVDAEITAGTADLSTDLGDVVCRGLLAKNLEAKSDLGDVKLWLPESREEYIWALETSLGSLTVDGQKQSGMGELSSQGGSGRNVVEAETSLGDIEVHFSE